MPKNKNYLDDDTDSDDLRRMVDAGQLPRSSVVTADDPRMKPGQLLREKTKELGCTLVTLRNWHVVNYAVPVVESKPPLTAIDAPSTPAIDAQYEELDPMRNVCSITSAPRKG